MRPDLFDAFARELKALSAQLDKERAELQTLEDREAAAIARVRTESLETLIREITSARNHVLATERNEQERVEKFARWRTLVATARRYKDMVVAAEAPIVAAQSKVDSAESQYFRVDRELGDYLGRPLAAADYPSEPEKVRWEDGRAKLEALVKEKSAALRELKTNLANLRNALATAVREFERAQFNERMGRLPETESSQGFGQLSGVR